ncbi:glycerophosphodiester phosphodiesterase family protein [Streptomyces sp. NPDC006172]|uniref:glycerophosphodiester phosphodiesterase n=1 Tax=Streptomyces sp. NPDC006172 TaxID=3154470 RepID=UPI0033F4DA1B
MHARAAATALLGTALTLSLPALDAQAATRGVPTPVRTPPAVVAHRGASAQAPENTLAAIDKAAALGVRWVENDVQRTKDGALVVIHDGTLSRTTDVEQIFPKRAPWNVKDFTAAEIARLDAGSWFGRAYTGARVPTLKQYLNRVEHNHQKLLLEIKNPEQYPGIERQTLTVLGAEGWLDAQHLSDRLIVQNFSADSLRVVHDLKPAVRTGLLGTPPVEDLPAYAPFTDLINPSYGSVSRGYVAAVHSVTGPHGRPVEVYVWTVDDPAVARTMRGYGVNGIITNKPDVVRRALYWY